MTQYNVIKNEQCFEGTCCLYLQSEVKYSSKTLVNFYQDTWWQSHWYRNLKFDIRHKCVFSGNNVRITNLVEAYVRQWLAYYDGFKKALWRITPTCSTKRCSSKWASQNCRLNILGRKLNWHKSLNNDCRDTIFFPVLTLCPCLDKCFCLSDFI